jgi:hypothetical protein
MWFDIVLPGARSDAFDVFERVVKKTMKNGQG